MKNEFEKLTFKYFCGVFNADDLHHLIKREINQNGDPHQEIYDLNAKEPYEAAKILLRIAKDKFQFIPNSLESESIAKESFIEVSHDYLDGKVNLNQYFSMIKTLENIHLNSECKYNELEDIHVPLYGYWWGNLYEFCDCLDSKWPPKNIGALRKEIESVLINFDKI